MIDIEAMKDLIYIVEDYFILMIEGGESIPSQFKTFLNKGNSCLNQVSLVPLRRRLPLIANSSL